MDVNRRSLRLLAARNHLQGTIEEIQLGDVLAHVTVRVAGGVIESVITRPKRG